jgi:hypothetical protein
MIDSDAEDDLLLQACHRVEAAHIVSEALLIDAGSKTYGEDELAAIRLAEQQLGVTTKVASHSVVDKVCEVAQAQLTARAIAPVQIHSNADCAEGMRGVRPAEQQLSATTAANVTTKGISQAHRNAARSIAIRMAQQQPNATTDTTSHSIACDGGQAGQSALSAPAVAPVNAQHYVYSKDEMNDVKLAEAQLNAMTAASASSSLTVQSPRKRSRSSLTEDINVELELESAMIEDEYEAQRIEQQKQDDFDYIMEQFQEFDNAVETRSAPRNATHAIGPTTESTLPEQSMVQTLAPQTPVVVPAATCEPMVQPSVAEPAVAHEPLVQTPVAVPTAVSAEYEYTLKKKGLSAVIETSRIMKDVGLILLPNQDISPAVFGNVRVYNQLLPVNIPADVMTAWTTPNLYDVLNAIPSQELVQQFYLTVPQSVQRVALEAITISPTLMKIDARTEYISEITKYWRSIHFAVSLKFREMTPLLLFTWVVIEGFAGMGTALLCLNAAKNLVLRNYPHVSIKVEKVLSYEIEPDAMFVHRHVVTPFIEREWSCTIEHNGDIANAVDDVVAKVPKYKEGIHIIMVAGTPCDDTSLANQAVIPAGKSCLHGPKSCNFFQWHRCCVRATRNYPRGSVVVVHELPKMKINADEHLATRYMGPAAYSNSKYWDMASRQRFWRCSPPVLDSLVTSPGDAQFRSSWVKKTQELHRTLIDGSRWHPNIPPQKPNVQEQRVEVPIIRRFWPTLVTKCKRGEQLSEFELMTVKNMRVCKNGAACYAGVAFAVDYMGYKGTPLQNIPALFKCDGRIHHKTKEKCESRDPTVANDCGVTEFCSNCARAMKVVGGAFEMNQGTEVFCRVLDKAMRHWTKREDEIAFFDFNQVPHDCGPECSLRP